MKRQLLGGGARILGLGFRILGLGLRAQECLGVGFDAETAF